MTQQPDDATITILLADDDPPIRQLMLRMLEAGGYRLLEACNGEDAARIARDYKEPIHLLVTDIVMPRASGFDVVRDLAASHPEAKVLYVSGYADDSVAVRGGLKESGEAFLLKPFTREALAQKIREVLGASPGAKP